MFKKLRYVLLGLVVSLSVSLSVKSFGMIPMLEPKLIEPMTVNVYDDYGHEVPFPRSALIFFPWDIIEGYWMTNVNDVSGVFQFKVDYTDPMHKRLKIAYLDRTSGRLLAGGYGYIDSDGKNILATLQGSAINASIILSAYKVSEMGSIRTEVVTNIQVRGNSSHLEGDSYVIKKVPTK